MTVIMEQSTHLVLKKVVRITLQINLLLLVLTRELGASYCSDEQIDSCKSAVKSNSLDTIPGGGICEPKQYVEFSQLCTVKHYVPSTDYCCCGYEQKILCCMYHQDWNYFRCSEAEDTVETISDEKLPLELLLAAILVPTAAALCCIICCIRCLCCRDDEDDTPCGCSKCHEKDVAVEKFRVGRSKRHRDGHSAKTFCVYDTKSPLSAQKGGETNGLSLTTCNGAVPSVPSAPPLEDPALAHLLSSQPQSSVVGSFSNDNVVQNSQSNNSGYFLHYVPLQSQNPPSKAIECAYQEIRPQSTVVPNAYQLDTRFSGAPVNCCHGNPTQAQTLIGILTKDDCPMLSYPCSPPPCEPPPAYEDANSEQWKNKTLDKDADVSLAC